MDDKKATYLTEEVAEDQGISLRRVQAQIKQGHYRAFKCTCGHGWIIDGESYRRYRDKRKLK